MATQNHNPACDAELTIEVQRYTLLRALIALNHYFDAGKPDEALALLSIAANALLGLPQRLNELCEQ